MMKVWVYEVIQIAAVCVCVCGGVSVDVQHVPAMAVVGQPASRPGAEELVLTPFYM